MSYLLKLFILASVFRMNQMKRHKIVDRDLPRPYKEQEEVYSKKHHREEPLLLPAQHIWSGHDRILKKMILRNGHCYEWWQCHDSGKETEHDEYGAYGLYADHKYQRGFAAKPEGGGECMPYSIECRNLADSELDKHDPYKKSEKQTSQICI